MSLKFVCLLQRSYVHKLVPKSIIIFFNNDLKPLFAAVHSFPMSNDCAKICVKLFTDLEKSARKLQATIYEKNGRICIWNRRFI